MSWSDGGAANHSLIAGASQTYIAIYQDMADAPVAADGFSRFRSTGWGKADIGGAYQLTAASTSFGVGNGAGIVRVGAGQVNGARLPISVRDADVTFAVSVDKLATGADQSAAAVVPSINSATEYRMRLRLRPDGTVVLHAGRATGSGETQLGFRVLVPGLLYAPGTIVHVRAQAVGAYPTTIRMRAWADGAPEPLDWGLEVTDSASALQGPGRVGLLARLPASTTDVPVMFSFYYLDVRVAGCVLQSVAESDWPSSKGWPNRPV